MRQIQFSNKIHIFKSESNETLEPLTKHYEGFSVILKFYNRLVFFPRT